MENTRYNNGASQTILKFIVLSSLCCVSLLAFRIIHTQSIYFLFLIWNLFLAFIPLGITIYILEQSELKKHTLFILLMVWLLFLPNAPYLITDLIHLKRSHTNLLWLDVLVIGSFAFVGIIAFYMSILNFKVIISKYFKPKQLKALLIIIYFLCGFGIYLGRYLRFNSWDILTHPKQLVYHIFDILVIDIDKNMYLYTFFFGIVLWISNVLLDQIRTIKS